ncbi:CubicO group peptidase (beta-lactamase class C family) [Fontibacillus phaseoli]|uniref:CubicO group peptidase (Beta-lactamase class C family) n=1 Tax=Fontibacillus phaseoli TaxID=1416533 RepID=A0A369B818_9BACL|nr:serine hydrolase domain-containing protein [Fontibacillus phaseoli]RCX17670.1 CubicO group peptidase (beta-lactamase class C family) [Fontibacillus phaseoli]
MNKWRRMSATVMAVLLLALPVAEGEAWANSDATTGDLAGAKAREMVETLIEGYGATGVQYAIRDEGKVVLSGGLGVNEAGSKAPVTKEAMFGIGSVSKMYVTAATMMLADEGKVNIDQPLTEYIPEFKMDDERYKQITPRMLMNHSAGLYGSHYKNSMLFEDNDTENHDKLLENLQSEKLKSEPGEYSVYANDGFQLLEILVERVSGMSYSEFLAQDISNPLQLTSTKTPRDDFNRDRLYPVRFPGIAGELPVENANVIGTGGIYSTAEELTLFSEVLTGERPDLLSKASATAMQKSEYRSGVWVKDESNIFGYGLGWDAVDLAPFDNYDIKAVTKGGDTVLYHSALIALPEQDISIALLSSGGSSIFNTVAASNILLAYLKETGNIADIQPDKTFAVPAKKDMPDSLNAYSGLYGTVGSTLQITIGNGEVDLPGMMDGLIPEQTYVYTGDREFTGKDGRTVISFDDQSNGHTYVRVKSYLELPGLGQSVIAYYESQKLANNPLADSVAQTWTERNGKTYYAVDEKINSLFYFSPQILSKTIELNGQNGYANGTKIKDGDHAVNIAEIPVMNGRDVFDLTFSKKDGVEYLQADGRIYISEAAVKPIYEGVASNVTIPVSGNARWFKVGEGAAGRTMTVDLSRNGGFAVYDANGAPVNISVATGTNTAVLPENGLIVFGGRGGDIMTITMESK